MSIVTLSRITWCGLARDKEKMLEKLQDLGCLHIIPLAHEPPLREISGPSEQALEALRFLLDTPRKRRQALNSENFDALEIEKQALHLRNRIRILQEEQDFLSGRIAALEPWGDFIFTSLEEFGGLRFWFYAVPRREIKKVLSRKDFWQIVRRDARFCYVVVISDQEPENMPAPRVHAGAKPLSELRRRLEEVETLLEELDIERKHLTRWCDLYVRNLYQVENEAARSEAGCKAYDQKDLFALEAWAPKRNIVTLKQAAAELHAALLEFEPAPAEAVPTLLENKPVIAGGQDLVTFYMTPGYRMWDPSSIVFFSFAAFFAMILSDAGYALLLSFFAAWKWKSMGRSAQGRRMRNLFAAILSASVVWGILAGSYFGFSPPAGSLLEKLKIFDLNDSKTMMLLSVSIGVFHLVLANALQAWRVRKTPEIWVPLGWIAVISGGMLAVFLRAAGFVVMGAGAAALLFFSSPDPNPLKRILSGLSQLGRLTSAFGDVLSYLRLFALGLASASLAITFNQLARQAQESIPGFGIVPALLIFLFGHALNLVLSLMSAVVHGLRLNVIEFFNWSMYEEGKPFQAFSKKGGAAWNP